MDFDWGFNTVAGVLVGVVSLAGFLKYVVKYTITKWLDNRFEIRIQKMQHDNELQIKKIEVQLNAKLDRETKINQKDFEIIPEMWVKISEAFRLVNDLNFSIRQQPDLNILNDLEMTELIEICQMSKSEQDAILSSLDKNRAFSQWQDKQKFIEASNAHRDSFLYLTRNSIILDAELKAKISQLQRLMFAAINEYDMRRFMKMGGGIGNAVTLKDDGKILLDEIELVMALLIRSSN